MEKLKGQLESYKSQPFSLVLRLLMWIATFLTVGITVCIVGYILIRGIPNLSPEMFAWEYNTENVSMMPAIINTVLMVLLVLLFAVPVGIGAAIYLVEYAKRGSKLVKLVRITAETLSGIPSIVYGLFGYLLFATTFKWGYTFLGGALTLAIMILPLILRTTEEALKAVPDSFREGSFGLGAGRLRTIFRIILPPAVPGIVSGVTYSTRHRDANLWLGQCSSGTLDYASARSGCPSWCQHHQYQSMSYRKCGNEQIRSRLTAKDSPRYQWTRQYRGSSCHQADVPARPIQRQQDST